MCTKYVFQQGAKKANILAAGVRQRQVGWVLDIRRSYGRVQDHRSFVSPPAWRRFFLMNVRPITYHFVGLIDGRPSDSDKLFAYSSSISSQGMILAIFNPSLFAIVRIKNMC